jgi:hypothetical protein
METVKPVWNTTARTDRAQIAARTARQQRKIKNNSLVFSKTIAKTEMYAMKYNWGQFLTDAAQTLSVDSMVVAFIYGRFGVASIESTPYVHTKCLCSRQLNYH